MNADLRLRYSWEYFHDGNTYMGTSKIVIEQGSEKDRGYTTVIYFSDPTDHGRLPLVLSHLLKPCAEIKREWKDEKGEWAEDKATP